MKLFENENQKPKVTYIGTIVPVNNAEERNFSVCAKQQIFRSKENETPEGLLALLLALGGQSKYSTSQKRING